ncbi:MAG TPA: malate/lactate/ureidoglycolate dehydrogenase [Candidatus Binatia bacterium]|nr:malate/lactate/ureidoglycolate dehydrogenase [Candidatus Binatia bacterium]
MAEHGTVGQGVTLAATILRRIIGEILRRGGSETAEADLVAEHLVAANLAGHDSHGAGMIPAYVRHLQAGLVVPNTPAKLVKDDGAILMFDGQRGYGRRVAGEAMAAAIARCRESGVVVMTLGHAHHIGRVGAYGELALAAGLVSLHFVNVTDHRGLVAPFRGGDARFSTNPICIAVPGSAAQPPILLDMATSEIAMGKVRVALNTGHQVPEGMLIDSDGRPTTDPAVMYQERLGALLPFGRHKGYGLALIAEILAGGLSGAGTIQPANPRRGGTVNNMVTFLVDPARLAGHDWLRREVEGFVGYVKASPPTDPEAPVLVPGDPERLARERRLREGIAVDGTTWHEILAAGEKLGLTRDEAQALAAS